jgi:prophage regulatory protein
VRLIKLPEVVRLTGVPKSSVYWRVARGEFPRPLKIGERASAWNSDEIEAWIAGKVAAANARAAA